MKKVMSHTQRQYVRWSKYWLNETDPKKKAIYLRNMLILSAVIDKERQRD